MMEPLISELSFLGDSNAYDQILQGTYSPPSSLDKYSITYIKELVKPIFLQ